MRVYNKSETRELRGNVFGRDYVIEPGGSITVADPKVAACLAEYGGRLHPEPGDEADLALAAAQQEWADENRAENARTASVPAAVAQEVADARSAGVQAIADPSQTGGTLVAPVTAVSTATSNPDGSQTYDPTAHNADDVKAYLATASPEEVARVKAVEQGRTSGNVRSSIVGWEPTAS